ncbi:hypothetical protein D5272_10880 [bacterium D16-76]|nr:hypothetical protein [bacterium D16-76]
MYTDKKKGRWPLAVLLAFALVILAALCWQAAKVSQADIEEEAAQAVKNAISQSAVQCYVVEGAYPPTLEYLEENYGLQVNREDFYVVYDVFAANLPPQVTVAAKP